MAKKFYLGNYYPASDRGQAILSTRTSFEEIVNTWDPARSGYVIRVNLKTGARASQPRRVIQ